MIGAPFRWMLPLLLFTGGCANIVPPSGGAKDETPPKLRSISPADSGLNTRVRKIELGFDEYIALSDASAQVQISPLLTLPLTVTALNKRVTIVIPDSLLQDTTTYRITFGTAIRDIHEGNIYKAPGYTFSTGAYFDSLTVKGTVHDARTGLPDTSAFVMLYAATQGDSAIVRRKPMYVTHVDGTGSFILQGLPPRRFRLYALRDANGNLTFDGGAEWIAFHNDIIRPAADTLHNIDLRTFPESLPDTAAKDSTRSNQRSRFDADVRSIPKITPGAYVVSADTGDLKRRTQELGIPLKITFGRRLSADVSAAKIFLSSDSAGAAVEAPVTLLKDSTGLQYSLITPWREDAVYTLRLQKGFAKDSAGGDLLPGRYTFRTKRDEDYGKLRIHLPSRYYGRSHILQVVNERDTVYQQPVLDTMVALLRLAPGVYRMRIIEDKNENGRWDAGDLFLRRQPEVVVPYMSTVNLKAGWEQQIDFEVPRGRKGDDFGNR